MAVLTDQRCRVWQSEYSLWAEAVRISPEMPRPRLNLGLELEKQGRMDEAMAQFEAALALAQTDNRMQKHQRMSAASAESNIGLILLTRGNWKDAIHHSNAALKYYPEIKTALVNRGTAFLALGQCFDAVADYRAAGISSKLPRC